MEAGPGCAGAFAVFPQLNLADPAYRDMQDPGASACAKQGISQAVSYHAKCSLQKDA